MTLRTKTSLKIKFKFLLGEQIKSPFKNGTKTESYTIVDFFFSLL